MLLCFIDMDKMKWINDTLGHDVGDEALVESANVLKGTFRESDIIGRMGGDEFAVLVMEAGKESDKIISDNLQNRLDAFNSQTKRAYKLSLSIGIACYDPEEPCSMDELISQADKLMYKHKQSKKSYSK